MAGKVYRTGIIGCGRIAGQMDEDPLRKTVMTHAGAYSRMPNVEIAAACDIDGAKLSDFGRKWGVKNLYHDYAEMLEKEKIDILSICALSGLHYDVARMAMGRAASLKAIFCEKPIATSLKDAGDMVEMAAKKKIVMAVNHVRRWDPHYVKLKEIVGSGVIGEVVSIVFYYSGGIANIGTHVFDTMRFLFGDADSVLADPLPTGSARGGKDIAASGRIFFKSGSAASLIACDRAGYLLFEIDIIGSKGRLKSLSNGGSIELYASGPSLKYSGYNELAGAAEIIKHGDGQRMVCAVEDIIKCIEEGKNPACSGQDGYLALEIVAAFYESLENGGRVKLPLSGDERNIFSK